MDPFEGAVRLSRSTYEAGYPESLAQFDQLADEPLWGEYARRHKDVRADILAEAKKLLSSSA